MNKVKLDKQKSNLLEMKRQMKELRVWIVHWRAEQYPIFMRLHGDPRYESDLPTVVQNSIKNIITTIVGWENTDDTEHVRIDECNASVQEDL